MSNQIISIANHQIGHNQPCFIIAEVGVNHNGDTDTALKMIDAAAKAGVDCVKFQTFSAEEFVNDPNDIYEYISQGETIKESMLEMFQRLELKREAFATLFDHARSRGLIPLSTPADRPAVDLLEQLDTAAFKIGSDDLVYTQFLQYVAKKRKPMIISTGMAKLADVERAVNTIEEAGNHELLILHCVSLYPTPEDQVNLRKIQTLQTQYGHRIGFSDHSWGITAALGAVSLGACVIEKHFTLDKNMPGPDHRFSADPEELTSLVREVRRLEQNLGSARFKLSQEEEEMAQLCHRSIVLNCDLEAGEELCAEHLAFRRPGAGLMPYQADSILGRKTRRSLIAGTVIDSTMIE